MVQTRAIALVLLVIFGCYGQTNSQKEQIEEIIAWMDEHVSKKLDEFRTDGTGTQIILNLQKSKVTDSIQTFVNITKVEIDRLTKVSQAEGKNIKECIKNVEAQFVSVAEDALEALSGCSRDSIQRIQNVFANARDSLPDVKATAKDILERFNNCADDPCKIEAVAYAESQMEQVSAGTESVAQQTRIDFRKIQEDLDCFTNVENTAKGKANENLQSFTSCTKSAVADGPNKSLNHYYFINNSLIILCSFIVGTLTNT